MVVNPSPREIITTLLPHLRVAASYAHHIQTKIKSLPEKESGNNFFAAALTDADISIQNLVEVALLGTFPQINFYGEEYQQSRNTKYFASTKLGSQGDYLITLDPIDGTRFYLDGHDNYQIILSILNADRYEGVIAISPAQNIYYYALRGEGAYQGKLSQDLVECQPLTIKNSPSTIFLGWAMGKFKTTLNQKYSIIEIEKDYSSRETMPNVNGIFSGKMAGVIIRRGQFIDGGALAFLAQEAGCIVTTFDGSPLPLLSECQNYSLPGLIIATSQEIHQDLVAACQFELES